MKMSFPTSCANAWSNHDHAVELLTRAPSLSERLPRLAVGFEFSNPCKIQRDSTRSVLFFTSKPLLVLVISRPKKLTVSPSWRNTTTSVKYRLIFMCSKSLMRCSVCVPCPPRHPCDARGSIRLIVVHGLFTCVEGSDINWLAAHVVAFSVCCEYSGHAPTLAVPRNNIGHPSHLLGVPGTVVAWMAPEEASAPTRTFHAMCQIGLRINCMYPWSISLRHNFSML